MISQENQGLLAELQERRWFRAWIASLVMFFVLAGGASLIFLRLTKRAEVLRHQQLLDPAAPDPGVTAADDTSTDGAVRVEVGYYVERIAALSVRDAAWTVEFDV